MVQDHRANGKLLDWLAFVQAEHAGSVLPEQYRLLQARRDLVSSALDLPSTASIRVRVGEAIHYAAGSGNGSFDAFIKALAKVLRRHDLTLPGLIDYEVRIPKGGRTDALTECIITWADEEGPVRTRGVHTNQVFAAIAATLRLVNILVHRAAQRVGALPVLEPGA